MHAYAVGVHAHDPFAGIAVLSLCFQNEIAAKESGIRTGCGVLCRIGRKAAARNSSLDPVAQA